MLVGRSDELAAVGAVLDADRPVVLVGEAGIGKTSLARQALSERGTWQESGALATLARSPLFLFRRLLGGRLPESPEGVAAEIVRTCRLPLLLDDLQWGDDSTLDVVRHLVGRVPMVATVRTGEPRSDEVSAALAVAGFEAITLHGLDPAIADAYLRQTNPELDERNRGALVTAAAGNPLLLGELRVGDSGSPTLISALLARMDKVSVRGRTVLERLAVLGRPVTLDELDDGEGAADAVASGLATAVDGRLEVRHALLGEVIIDLLGTRADEIRRTLATQAPPAEAARLLAVAGDHAAARRVALQEVAGADTDRQAQAELLALAVDNAEPGDLDVANRLRAARLFTELSQMSAALELCEVDGLDELAPVDRGGLRAAAAEAMWALGRGEACVALLELALADLGGTGTELEVLALAGSTIVETWIDLDGRPALARAREAVRLADEIGAGQAYAKARLGSVLYTAGEPGWPAQFREAITDAAASGDHATRRAATISMVLAHWVSGDPAEAERLAQAEVAGGPRHPHDVYWLSQVAYAALLGLLHATDLPSLVRDGRVVLDEEPVFRSRPFLESAVGIALSDLGRHVEAAELLKGTVERAGPDPQWRSVAWWGLAESAWNAGRLDDVERAAEGADRTGAGAYPPVLQCQLLAGHSRREQELPLIGEEPPLTLPPWRGAVLEWRALEVDASADHAGARDRFEEAALAWHGHDARSELRCRWAAADAARRAGDGDAVPCLLAVQEEAQRRQLHALGARIRRSLRGAGVPSRTPPGTTVAGLTAREVEVLDLVASGSRSSDIAASLAIEVSTVDWLVRSAVRKLGAPTRLAAVARLQAARADGSTGA